jgi:CPA2 family monovalent cation:H+ antiporter-2
MHHLMFLQDLAIVMIVAALVTLIFHRLKQPVVLGYILAGVIIGPHTPPFPLISQQETIETLSELGVIFLMFSLGLEFSLRKLRAVGSTAFIAASLEILVMVWAGYEAGRLFGWGTMDSVFLGAILSISSTTIIIKALEELGKTREKFAELIFGILIVEDILAIVMLALLSGFAATGSLSPMDVGKTVGKLSLFLAVLLVVGLIAVPRLLNYVARFKSNEMLVVMVVGLCFGVSLLAAKLGYSVALGAFLIGAVIAEARQIGRIESLMLPVRDLFSAVFFVSIGLLIDPKLLAQYAAPILIITAVVVAGKVFACSVGTFIAGNDTRTSLRVGMGLAQIGEFSFIIASLGLSLKVTSGFLYPIAVAVSVLTTLLTPYLVRGSDSMVQWFYRTAPDSLLGYLDQYTRWIGQLGQGSSGGPGGKLLRKWGWQMGLNLILVTAVFIAAAYARGYAMKRFPDAPGGEDGIKAILWLGAMLVSLPMLIAVFRKLQAAGMLAAEMSVSHAAGGERTGALRTVVSKVILAAGCLGIFLCVLALSSALLPSLPVVIVLALALISATGLLWRTFIRLHARAQGALQETFAQPPAPRNHHGAQETAAPALPPLLHEAELRTVALGDGSPAVGKLIAELRLRSLTGASIVGIERNGQNLINPAPDEELQAGDQLLLLGSGGQLESARSLMSGG